MSCNARRTLIVLLLATVMIAPAFALMSGPADAATGGNDGKGHRWFDTKNPVPKCNYNWIEINGTNDTGITGDDSSANKSLNFPISFYGVDYYSINISSNGYLDFGSPNTYHTEYWNDQIPTASMPNNAVYPFWDDLHPKGRGTIWFAETGLAPNRMVVVEWEHIFHYGWPAYGNYTFEAILYENDTEYKFQYKGMYGNGANGISATIGIENQTGGCALLYSYGQAVITNGSAIVINQTNEQHDMAIMDISGPAFGKLNEPMQIPYNLTNIGRSDQTGVNVSLRVDDVPVDWTGPVNDVTSFDSIPLHFNWTPTMEGNFTVSVRAEPLALENVTFNNELNFSVYVRNWKGGVLVDQSHGCWNALNFWQAMENITDMAYYYDFHNSGQLTSALLQQYDVFMAFRPNFWSGGWMTYTSGEMAAIQDFVSNRSGNLLVVGGDTWLWNPFISQEILTGWVGIHWYAGGTAGVTNRIVAHNITENVSQVKLAGPNAKLSVEGVARALVNDTSVSPNATGEAMLAVSQSNQGKVAAFADETSFGNSSWDLNDNARLFRQIFHWFMRPPENHDLAVVNVAAPELATTGTAIKITGTVANFGLRDQTGINVTLLIDGTPTQWTGPVKSITHFTSEQIAFQWTPSGHTNYTVTIRVDPVSWENITDNNEMDVNVDARVWGAKVLVDQLHGCANHTAIAPALEALVDSNIMWETHTSGAITSGVLAPYDIFISLRPDFDWWAGQRYTVSELNAIRDHVTNKSKAMFVMGGSQMWWKPAINLRSLTQWVGIDWHHWWWWGTTTNVNAHEVTQGISQVYIERAMMKLGLTMGAIPLVNDTTVTPNATGEPMLAVSMSGSGKIAAFTDHTAFGPNGFSQNDNEKLFRAVIDWFFPDTDVPAVPTGLNVAARPAGNVLDVGWDANTELDLRGYSLMRAQGSAGGSYDEIYSNISARHRFVDYGLTNDVQYFYKVAAFDEIPNLSDYSTPVGGTPADVLKPDTPANLEVVNTGTGDTLYLSWLASGARDLEGYSVYVSDSETGTYEKVTDLTAEFTNYNHTDLTEDQKYWYKVGSQDEVPNESDLTSAVSGTPHDTLAPGAPTGLGVLDTGMGGELQLYWNLGDDVDLGGYRLFRSTQPSAAFAQVAELGPTESTHFDSGLNDDKKYYYKLKGIDDAVPPNESPFSLIANGIPTDFTAPGIPANLTAQSLVDIDDDGHALYYIDLSWDAPADADLAGIMVYKSLQTGVTPTAQYFLIKLGPLETTFTDEWVDEDKTYFYVVSAVDEVPNESLPTAEASAEVRDMQAPPTPDDLEVEAPDTGGELVISWDRVDDRDTAFYSVYWSSTKGGAYEKLEDVDESDRQEYVHEDLTNGETYFYRVSASDDADPPNESPLSDVVAGIPRDGTPPETPTGLLAGSLPEGGAVVLSWNANTEDDLDGYYLYRRTGAMGLQEQIARLGAGETTFTDISVTDGKQYRYSVAAFDGVPNASPLSAEVYVTPEDGIAPEAPGGVRTEVEGDIVTITWDEGEEDDIRTYIVYVREGDSWAEVDRVDAGVTRATFVAPRSGEYAFTVIAVDTAPNKSERSDEATATVTLDDTGGDGGSGGSVSDKDRDGSNTLAIGILVAVIIAVVVVLLLVLMMRRKPQAGAQAAPGDMPPPYGAPPPGGAAAGGVVAGSAAAGGPTPGSPVVTPALSSGGADYGFGGGPDGALPAGGGDRMALPPAPEGTPGTGTLPSDGGPPGMAPAEGAPPMVPPEGAPPPMVPPEGAPPPMVPPRGAGTGAPPGGAPPNGDYTDANLGEVNEFLIGPPKR